MDLRIDAEDVDAAYLAVLEELQALPGFELPPGEDAPPAQDAPQAQEEPAPAEDAPAGPPRVVVVTDDPERLIAIREALVAAGCEAYGAQDAAAGLKLALSVSPELVAADYHMPRMNGYELVVAMRAEPALMLVPVLLFTGDTGRHQLEGLDLAPGRTIASELSAGAVLSAARKLFPGRVAEGAPEPEAPAPPPRAEAPLPASAPQEPAISAEEPVEDDAEAEASALDEEADSPVIAEVNHLLAKAVTMGASDIHVEPDEEGVAVRYRVDGALQTAGLLPRSLHRRLAARVKIMAGLAITERRLPQDGQIRAVVGGRKVEFRVSTIPTRHGEHIVMRVLGGAAVKARLSELGMNARDLECLELACQASDGLILVTGPTGSGKTTTLYTVLNRLRSPEVKIVTAEDPVEHELKGISQVTVRAGIGLTFERVLRAFMRQDPDVMLIGEIRDLETADIAIKASITGHLVLSTLHTNSAAAAVTRLTQMGVPPYLVSASVRLVVAQRLLRVLCPSCKTPAVPSDAEKRLLAGEEAERSLRSAFQAVGCALCANTGYKGRMPIFEVMPLQSPQLRRAVDQGQTCDALQALAASEGMTPLRDAAVAAVLSGQTSFAEALPYLVAR